MLCQNFNMLPNTIKCKKCGKEAKLLFRPDNSPSHYRCEKCEVDYAIPPSWELAEKRI